MLRYLKVLTLALVLGAAVAQGQEAGRISSGGAVSLAPTSASLVTAHDRLAAEFRRLAEAAIGPEATAEDREAISRFVRRMIEPRLRKESWSLFPTFDSIVGGGYAVPANLFDLDGVSYLVKEIERTTATGERAAFETRLYALSVALESYFTKVQLLVVPVLKERLGETALGALAGEVEAGRTRP